MIIAKFYQKPKDGSIHMTLKGHAKAAPKGEDLICASATMMASSVAQAVQFMFEQGMLKKKPKIFIKNGEVVDKQVGAAPKSTFVDKVKALL